MPQCPASWRIRTTIRLLVFLFSFSSCLGWFCRDLPKTRPLKPCLPIHLTNADDDNVDNNPLPRINYNAMHAERLPGTALGRRRFIWNALFVATATPSHAWAAVNAQIVTNNNEKNKDMDDRTSSYTIQHTEEEWRSILSPLQYDVLRNGRTERPYSSVLDKEKRQDGMFECAGCQTDLFSPSAKFDSGTGWPSFSSPISNMAVEIENVVLPKGILRLQAPFVTKKEVRCATCGGHLGHVFDDGFLFVGTSAFQTNNRFCINGSAIAFRPTTTASEASNSANSGDVLLFGDSCRSPRTGERFNTCLAVPL